MTETAEFSGPDELDLKIDDFDGRCGSMFDVRSKQFVRHVSLAREPNWYIFDKSPTVKFWANESEVADPIVENRFRKLFPEAFDQNPLKTFFLHYEIQTQLQTMPDKFSVASYYLEGNDFEKAHEEATHIVHQVRWGFEIFFRIQVPNKFYSNQSNQDLTELFERIAHQFRQRLFIPIVFSRADENLWRKLKVRVETIDHSFSVDRKTPLSTIVSRIKRNRYAWRNHQYPIEYVLRSIQWIDEDKENLAHSFLNPEIRTAYVSFIQVATRLNHTLNDLKDALRKSVDCTEEWNHLDRIQQTNDEKERQRIQQVHYESTNRIRLNLNTIDNLKTEVENIIRDIPEEDLTITEDLSVATLIDQCDKYTDQARSQLSTSDIPLPIDGETGNEIQPREIYSQPDNNSTSPQKLSLDTPVTSEYQSIVYRDQQIEREVSIPKENELKPTSPRTQLAEENEIRQQTLSPTVLLENDELKTPPKTSYSNASRQQAYQQLARTPSSSSSSSSSKSVPKEEYQARTPTRRLYSVFDRSLADNTVIRKSPNALSAANSQDATDQESLRTSPSRTSSVKEINEIKTPPKVLSASNSQDKTDQESIRTSSSRTSSVKEVNQIKTPPKVLSASNSQDKTDQESIRTSPSRTSSVKEVNQIKTPVHVSHVAAEQQYDDNYLAPVKSDQEPDEVFDNQDTAYDVDEDITNAENTDNDGPPLLFGDRKSNILEVEFNLSPTNVRSSSDQSSDERDTRSNVSDKVEINIGVHRSSNSYTYTTSETSTSTHTVSNVYQERTKRSETNIKRSSHSDKSSKSSSSSPSSIALEPMRRVEEKIQEIEPYYDYSEIQESQTNVQNVSNNRILSSQSSKSSKSSKSNKEEEEESLYLDVQNTEGPIQDNQAPPVEQVQSEEEKSPKDSYYNLPNQSRTAHVTQYQRRPIVQSVEDSGDEFSSDDDASEAPIYENDAATMNNRK